MMMAPSTHQKIPPVCGKHQRASELMSLRGERQQTTHNSSHGSAKENEPFSSIYFVCVETWWKTCSALLYTLNR